MDVGDHAPFWQHPLASSPDEFGQREEYRQTFGLERLRVSPHAQRSGMGKDSGAIVATAKIANNIFGEGRRLM